jgi:hypothetical protein
MVIQTSVFEKHQFSLQKSPLLPILEHSVSRSKGSSGSACYRMLDYRFLSLRIYVPATALCPRQINGAYRHFVLFKHLEHKGCLMV